MDPLLLMPVSVDESLVLGPYAPTQSKLVVALHRLALATASEFAPTVVDGERRSTPGGLEVRVTFRRLDPDTDERPFANVQAFVEVVQVSGGKPIYSRTVEAEVRRIFQRPVPMDGPRFELTALGRATQSCLRSLFTSVAGAVGK